MKLINFAKLGLFSLFVSCASSYRPESMEQAFNRIKAREVESNLVNPPPIIEENQIASLYENYNSSIEQEKKLSRNIASTNESNHSNKKNENLFKDYSNKRVYFLTLLTQYYEIKKLFKIDSPDIKICPKFHSSLLDNDRQIQNRKNMQIDSYKLSKNYFSVNDLSKNQLGYHPELFLSLNSDEISPTLFDELKNISSSDTKKIDSLTAKAYSVHVKKLFNEINQLCEDGYSRNYYIYENLTQHFQGEQNRSNSINATNNLKILTKTSIFTNMLLKAAMTENYKITQNNNLIKEDFNSKTDPLFNWFEVETLKRLNQDWSQLYLKKIKDSKH